MIGVFMGALDLTILAPALPDIAGSLNVSAAAVVLAFSIYAAFYAASVPLMSKLSDVRGYRPVYGWSLFLFTAGSALAALAPNLPVLVFARLVQGAGGGGLFPVAQTIAGAAYPEHHKGRIFALLLGVFALGGVLGPNLGGFLVQTASWHWIFWINVPLGLGGLLLMRGVQMPDRRRRGRIDWRGVVLVAWTFGALVLAIESLRHLEEASFLSLRIGAPMLAAVAGLVLLVLVERRTQDPILNVHLIASATLAPVLIISFLIGYALLSAVALTPFYVQLRFGASTLGSGAILNAAAAGLVASAAIAAAFTNRVGPRTLVVLGMASTTAGITVMVTLAYSLWGILSGLVFLGLGLGLAQGPLSHLALTLAPLNDQGQVAGLVSVMRSMGAAMGISVSGVFLGEAAVRLSTATSSRYAAEIDVESWGTSSGIEALRSAPEVVQEAIRSMLSSGVIDGWYWALGAAAIGLLVSLKLRASRPLAWQEGEEASP